MNRADELPELKEKFNPRLIAALYKNFKDSNQAILELIDNAIDDRIEGKTMTISVDIEKNHICIVNKGGKGMSLKELESFLEWGFSEKIGKLGRYGQGGKAAMGYLGKSWVIRSTKAGEGVEYEIKDDDWDDRANGLKKYKPTIDKASFLEEGVVQIDINGLKRKINRAEIKKTLGNIYRPLIESGEIEIYCRGRVDTVDFPLDEPRESIEFQLKEGQKVNGWLGILEEGSNIKGGIRCNVFGRLIVEKEFFNQKEPSYKESINKLIGEININFDIDLLMNKSDFDRSSKEWQQIRDEMFKKLDPYISSLLEEKERDLPSEKEKKAVTYAGEVWKDFLKYLNHLQKEGSLPGLPSEFGQKQIEKMNGKQQAMGERKTEQIRGPYEPATPPPPDALGKRRRTGAFPKPILQPLPDYIRYQPSEKDGEKVILINTKFPLYKIRNKQIPLYTWETLILEYAKAEEKDTQTVEEYIEEMNNLSGILVRFIREKKVKIIT